MPKNMSDNAVSFADLFSQGQIRLAELSVFNWGSFHGLHNAAIDPMGTLVTGDNGAGKSTLIDGLMALLLPAGKATFNVAAAQGDRSDRSLLSYMRGSFGTAHDGSGTRVKSKREKGVVTGLRALYRFDDGSCVTLAGLFWTTGSTNALSDVKRLYCVARRNLQLKEMLDAFGEGNVRQLKQWLRNDPEITDCDHHFADYQEIYRKLLHMDNKNAPALLSRALGLKKIDDLTKLIRELVLEPSSVRDDARRVVDEFSDLVSIYTQLTDAKDQCSHLSRLPALSDTILQSARSLETLLLEKNHVAVYFGKALSLLWADKVREIMKKLSELALQFKNTEIEEQDAQNAVEQRHEEYLNLGGDKVESLKKDIGYIQDKLSDIIRMSSQYQRDCQSLELSYGLNETEFHSNRQTAADKIQQIESDTQEFQDAFAAVAGQVSESQKSLAAFADEIREMEARPDSNIDVRFQQLKEDILESLEMSRDDLVFIGELIDVKDEEKPWQGAIERALGGLKTTLLVPRKSYSMVTRWLNVRHTGLHVRLQVVSDHTAATADASFSSQGYLSKLIWKEHHYAHWLQQFLCKFDLKCVAGTEELNKTPFSMTREGLVQMESGRFEKKDQKRVDDRRNWCLGFSNKSRLQLLKNDYKHIQSELEKHQVQLTQARQSLNSIADKAKLWERLHAYNWDQINAPYWQKRFDDASADLKQLEASGGSLEQAKNRWNAAKLALQAIQRLKETLLVQKGALEKDEQNARDQQAKSQAIAAGGMSDDIRILLQKRVGAVTFENAEGLAAIEKNIDRELDKVRAAQNTAENIANGIMASFRGKEKWQPLTIDWPTGLAGLPDYLAHFNQLESEGLPALVDQFKERLNKHATQSLARIKTKLESEREEILERIETINQVLKRTEFKQGSHLKLGSRKEKYPHVLDFERKLRDCLSHVTSDDHEMRFRLLSNVVEVLEKASTTSTSYTLESLRLLDPRYQMSFYAEEIDTATEEVRDVLESSSGKSGGEKESFAGAIVAASLAYVLTPDGFDKPVYCTVFLDEAFSNTAEAVSRRVLKVFKELHIHVNLITPYKNLNLARESARSLLIAERRSDVHEGHLCEVTWEEIDERMVKARTSSIKAQAKEFDVIFDPQ